MTESKSAGEAPLQTNKPVDPDAPFDPRASRSSSPSIEPQPQPSQNEGNQPSPSPTAGFDSLNAEERDTLNFKERALNDPMVRTLVDKFQGTVQSIEDLRENPQP